MCRQFFAHVIRLDRRWMVCLCVTASNCKIIITMNYWATDMIWTMNTLVGTRKHHSCIFPPFDVPFRFLALSRKHQICLKWTVLSFLRTFFFLAIFFFFKYLYSSSYDFSPPMLLVYFVFPHLNSHKIVAVM